MNAFDYGYDEGLLSNSQMQAAIQCGLKYKRLYLDRLSPELDRPFRDAASAGTICHSILEQWALEGYRESTTLNTLVPLLKTLFPSSGPIRAADIYKLLQRYQVAYRDCQEVGAHYGKKYTAIEFTSHYKRTYGELESELTRLDGHLIDPHFELPVGQWVRRLGAALENLSGLWQQLRKLPGGTTTAEQVLTYTYTLEHGDGTVEPVSMVGTIDRVDRNSDQLIITDYKSGNKKYSGHDLRNSDQFVGYSVAVLRSIYGKSGNTLTSAFYSWVERYLVEHSVTIRVVMLNHDQIITAPLLFNDVLRWKERLRVNLLYVQGLKKVLQAAGDGEAPLPIPGGMGFKLGCPCILAHPLVGECPYIVLH